MSYETSGNLVSQSNIRHIRCYLHHDLQLMSHNIELIPNKSQ